VYVGLPASTGFLHGPPELQPRITLKACCFSGFRAHTSAPKEDPHSLGADVPAAHCGTWRGITDRNVPDKCERRAAYAAPETATAPTSARVLIGSCAFLFPTERKRNGGPKTFPRAGRLPLKS